MNTMFNQYCSLAATKAGAKLVSWHITRSIAEAENYSEHIMPGEGQRIVGGKDVDSVGDMWWVGVAVDDLAHWGNNAAVNKHAE